MKRVTTSSVTIGGAGFLPSFFFRQIISDFARCSWCLSRLPDKNKQAACAQASPLASGSLVVKRLSAMASSVKNHASGEVRKIQMFNHFVLFLYIHIYICNYVYIYIFPLPEMSDHSWGRFLAENYTQVSYKTTFFLFVWWWDQIYTAWWLYNYMFLTLVVIKMHANYHSVTIKSLSYSVPIAPILVKYPKATSSVLLKNTQKQWAIYLPLSKLRPRWIWMNMDLIQCH